jgi:hypothetical protein
MIEDFLRLPPVSKTPVANGAIVAYQDPVGSAFCQIRIQNV